ncbi:MAG: TauD/TfdA family dioxygenase [Novosphingobium sp.]|nr:TauD/TfdA family dioxygenase [Novosphingobium sp.]
MAQSTLTITPLDPVGAQVSGFAGSDFSPEEKQALNQAWLDYGVLLFRGIDSAEQHLALSRCFGELEIHPIKELRDEDNPFFFPLGGPPMVAQVYDEQDIRVGRIPWHRDTAFRPEICKGSMLRVLEARTSQGETLLGDTAAAYDALPDEVKQRIETLEYIAEVSHGSPDYLGPANWWKTARMARDDEYPEGVEPPRDIQWPDNSGLRPVIYPAVLRHPESGRACLFLSPMNIRHFLGMSEQESEELVTYLVRHMVEPRFVYRHHWSDNDAVLWDNRRFIHAANGYPATESRLAQRTTLADKMHAGRPLETVAAE